MIRGDKNPGLVDNKAEDLPLYIIIPVAITLTKVLILMYVA